MEGAEGAGDLDVTLPDLGLRLHRKPPSPPAERYGGTEEAVLRPWHIAGMVLAIALAFALTWLPVRGLKRRPRDLMSPAPSHNS
jgi:hypothetical protein